MKRPTRMCGKRPRLSGSFLCVVALLVVPGCRSDPELRPDEVLQAELGLNERDEVYRVTVTGGDAERAEPTEVTVPPGAYLEFVTADWLVHEVRFELDSLSADARAFLERTDQFESPPMIQRDSRFVLSFVDAPTGRYPYVLEGNAPSTRGVVIVYDERAR